jgi:quercetin dioxygenase-like cupin family protein
MKTILANTLVALSLLSSGCNQNEDAGSRAPADTAHGEASRTGTSPERGAPPKAVVGDSLWITRGGTRPTQQGSAEQFTGTVRIEPLFATTDSSRAAAASVTFEPGARTAWHRHPRGQMLILTAGTGRVQRRGGPVEEFHADDVVWTAPDVEHWHGAAPATMMAHIAIQEHAGGKVVEWGQKVTDAEYGAR